MTTREPADRGLSDLVAAARQALGDTLDSIVLYGSAAEVRLRPASDVNVIFVLIVSMPRRVHAACVSDCLFASGGDRSGSSRCGRCSSIVCRCRSPDPVYDLLVEVGAPVRRPPTVILERDGVFCVMRPEFETFLARLYTDAPSRARFLPAPREEADRHGLTVEECAALERIDRVGLEVSARSFAHKRMLNACGRPGGRGGNTLNLVVEAAF